MDEPRKCTPTNEQIEDIARRFAAVGIPFDELKAAIVKVLEGFSDIAERLADWFREIEDSGVLDTPPCITRKRKIRERAKMIEQSYRAKIKQFERVTPLRRIYKPP